MARVNGIVKVILNGVDHRTKQGAVLETGGFQKTSQYASGKRTGSSYEPIASKITFMVEHTGDADLDALKNFEGEAIYETDVGQQYLVANAETMEPPRIQDNGQGIEVTIEGDPAELT